MSEDHVSGNAAQGGSPLLSSWVAGSALEPAVVMWLGAQWSDLIELDETRLQDAEDRARLCLMQASAFFRLGNFSAARARLQEAQERGCSRQDVAEFFVAMMQDTIGCVESCLEDEAAAKASFAEAVRPFGALVADVGSAARHRQICALSRLGFLSKGQQMLLEDVTEAHRAPADNTARLAVMQSQIEMLGYELSLALDRGQVMAAEAPTTVSHDDLKRRSTSQLGQDLWVLGKTGFKRGGFFVEFGATDGIRLSNTLLLEREFEWQGICAEPNPRFFEDLRRNRRCTVAPDCIGARSGEAVEFVLADEFGGISEHAFSDQHTERRQAFKRDGRVMQVTTISLDDFLRKHGAPRRIDYLSIDTEGSEYEILETFPFDEWRIDFITVEHNWSPTRDKIEKLLTGRGYRRTEAEFDDWYELHEA